MNIADLTKDIIKEKIAESDGWLYRGIEVIYERQTRDEQRVGHTKYNNRVGFSGVDSGFMSSIAQWLRHKGFLTIKQKAKARRIMKKYAGQILKIAKGEI